MSKYIFISHISKIFYEVRKSNSDAGVIKNLLTDLLLKV